MRVSALRVHPGVPFLNRLTCSTTRVTRKRSNQYFESEYERELISFFVAHSKLFRNEIFTRRGARVHVARSGPGAPMGSLVPGAAAQHWRAWTDTSWGSAYPL